MVSESGSNKEMDICTPWIAGFRLLNGLWVPRGIFVCTSAVFYRHKDGRASCMDSIVVLVTASCDASLFWRVLDSPEVEAVLRDGQ